MKDSSKTNRDLIAEISILKKRIQELEQSESERKRAEEALQQSEKRYRLFFESNPHPMWVYDLETLTFLTVNDAAIRKYGYSREEFLGMTIADIRPQEDVSRLLENVARVTDGLDEAGAWRHRRKDGAIIAVEIISHTLAFEGRKAELVLAQDITKRKRAEEELRQTLESLRKAVGTTVQVMVSAVESRDPYTAGHQLRSADLARAIATEMGLPQEKINGIRMAGSIHDIGKLSIPAEILAKPTKLTDIEFSLIKEHSLKGYEMLKDVESPWPLAEIVYQHHERMDGSGYPRNLKGEEILIEARILAVCDVVESMASHRPYRPAIGLNAALEEIEKNKGTIYDSNAVDVCLRLFREKGFQLAGT